MYIVTATDYQAVFSVRSLVQSDCRKQEADGSGGGVLLDDGVHNLIGGAYRKLLMDAPHNRAYDAEENGMRRVRTWEAAYRMIAEINKEQGKL